MFLDVVKRRNPQLIDTAITLHQTGQILPNTYVLDLDAIRDNANLMAETARIYGIDLFYMTKQFGRNPLVSKAVEEAGITHSVVVDYQEALTLMASGLKLGNVGHLVQIPNHLLRKIMAYGTKFITVFSLDILKAIDEVAQSLNMTQSVLLKVIDDKDTVYDGQYGGFRLDELNDVMCYARTLKNIHLAGLTSFPCFLYDGELNLKPTPNVKTLHDAKEIFQSHGLTDIQLNMPSATCVKTIPFIRQLGGHHGEPGHALTGTTPLHAVSDLPELPSMVYVSEISHHLNGKSYFYGGGHYRRGHFENVLVEHCGHLTADTVELLDDTSIDYYFATHHQHHVGNTVIGSFRTQIFVTRSYVAVVSGIQKGKPIVEGIFTSLGERVEF